MLKPIQVYQIKSPCFECPGDSPACRANCRDLDKFLHDLQGVTSYGVSDFDSDYSFSFHSSPRSNCGCRVKC
jgi:hypothetical protein